MLRVNLFGELHVATPEGTPLELIARKPRALFALLAQSGGKPQSRERLAHLLWGDVSGDQHSRKSLRQALSVLRRVLPGDTLRASREHICIDPANVEVDVLQFEALCESEAGEDLSRAIELYSGEMLEGFSARADGFDEWLALERQRYKTMVLGTLTRLAASERRQGRLEEALAFTLRLASLDPLRERTQQLLMELYAQQGHVAEALLAYQAYARALQRELDASPSPALAAFYARLQSGSRDAVSPILVHDEQPQLRLVALFAVHCLTDCEDEVLRVVMPVIAEFGGSLVRRQAQLLLIGFGLRHAQTNDPLRAISAARRVLKARRVLSLGVGVGYGIALVSQARENVQVSGEVASATLALAGQTTPGELLVTEAVQHVLSGQLDTEERRGLRLPPGHRAFRVLSVQSERSTPLTPLVGRERERALLAAMLDDCSTHQRCMVVVIRGEAGIGKSRLFDEALATATQRGYEVYRARAVDFGPKRHQDVIGQIADQLLRAEATRAEDADDASAPSSRRSSAETTLLDELAYGAASRAAQGDEWALDARRNERRLQLWCELVKARSERSPAVLAIDDVHWATHDTVAALRALLPLVEEQPLLLLLCTRPALAQPSELEMALMGTSYATLELGPLSLRDSEQLVRSLCPQSHPELASKVIARSGGHPLFLEQLLQARGAGVPASVHAVVQSRLDSVPASAVDALRTGAVLGQRFDVELVAQLSKTRPDVEPLVTLGLLRRDSGGLWFAHDIIREAVYATLSGAERRALHRRAAECLGEADLALSAKHLDLAEAPEAATVYLRAARAELLSVHPARALQMADRGLSLAIDDDTRFQLCALRVQSLTRVGRLEAAVDACEELRGLAKTDPQKLQAWLLLAETLRATEQGDATLRALAAAEQLAKVNGPAALSHIFYLRGNILFPRGQARECLQAHQTAYEHALRAKDEAAQARALSGIADAHYSMGKLGDAQLHYERCVSLAEQLGLVHLELVNRSMLGIIDFFQLRVEESLRAAEQLLERALSTFDARAETLTRSLMMLPRWVQGDVELFENAARQLYRSAENSGRRRLLLLPSCHLLEARLARGQCSDADDQLRALYQDSSSDRPFVGLAVLGAVARLARADDTYHWALAEADTLIAQQQYMSHSLLAFGRDAVLAGAARRDTERVRRYSQLLFAYAEHSGAAFARFYAELAASFAEWHDGGRSAGVHLQLQQLLTTATERGLAAERELLQATLAESDAPTTCVA